MYGLLFAMGSAFLLIVLAILCAVAVLLWWLAKNKKREWYIGFFVIAFLYNAYTIGHALSGVSAMWYIILAAWTYFISSIAMWRAATKNQKFWFGALLLFQIYGILPAIYVWGVEKMKQSDWYK